MNSTQSSPILKPREALYHMGGAENDAAHLKALATNPKGEGLSRLKEGKHHQAVPLLERALELAPDDVESLIGLGKAMYAGSRWLAAEPIFARAVSLAPNDYEARVNYAESLLKNGRFHAAEKEYQMAIQLLPWWTRMLRRLNPKPLPSLHVNPVGNDPYEKLAFAAARRETIQRARASAREGKPNAAWHRAERGRKFGLRNQPLIKKDTKIFAMGSCFALEIRHELLRRGYDVFPKYTQVDFDPDTQIVNSLPERDNINHYDTFTIRQEFEQAFAGTHFQLSDFWKLKGTNINKAFDRPEVWQDPYRKNIYAVDESSILDISQKLDSCILEGILAADVYVITLGLIEAWLNPKNNLHACCYPGVGGGGGDGADSTLHLANFSENYENMRRVCDLIFTRFPEKHLILTVSPVALERTFTDRDVVVANMESKCQLRAVAGQLSREFPNVHYFPSFELFIYHDLHHDNGRHASKDGVEVVVDFFAKSFVAPDSLQEKSA